MSDVRLIDANALMNTIRQHEYQLAAQRGTIDYGMFTIGIQQAVDEQPTINPEDCREHGRWTETNWAECDGHGEVITFHDITALRCSNCCYCFKKELLWRKNYCPNCGAKMDGEEQQEKVCDTCRFNPPSSFDGKPCSQCSDDYSCWQRKGQGE